MPLVQIGGTTALVTGGGSGLGAATVRALAASGAHVVVVDRDTDAGAEIASELGDAGTFAHADVTDPDSVAAAVQVASSTASPLRIVVNCAGIAIGTRTVGRNGSPADLTAFRRVIDVNLVGTYATASLGAAAMATAEPLDDGERGVIVNTASIAAYEGQIGQTAYAASKGGVVALTLPMARDLATLGIRVNTIAPGIVGSDPDGGAASAMIGGLDTRYLEALADNVPFPKRLGYPSEYAALVVAIVENGYINGETIRMDGALRMAPK